MVAYQVNSSPMLGDNRREMGLGSRDKVTPADARKAAKGKGLARQPPSRHGNASDNRIEIDRVQVRSSDLPAGNVVGSWFKQSDLVTGPRSDEPSGSNLTFNAGWDSRCGLDVQVCAMRAGKSLSVSFADIRRLKAVVQDRNAPQKHVWRAEIVLLTADGVGTNEIMRRTAKSKTCVWRWQERFIEEGFDGLLRDKTRPSRIKPLSAEAAERVVALTFGDPPGETTHWTGALMAKAVGLSVSSVQRIWRAHGLQPHRMRQFKLSNDPRFVDKLRDVVGLYVDPPAHAIVLSVDEKSQIQALDRTQPGLPLKKGRAGTMTHDYERHGRRRCSPR